MDTIITDEFARRSRGDLFTHTRTALVAVSLVGCLAFAGFTAALTGAGAASSAQADSISVDRTHKGDRLSLLPKPTSKTLSHAVTTLARPPVGCESAFSRTADPDRAHIFGRCIS
jgi:hypothetical protein